MVKRNQAGTNCSYIQYSSVTNFSPSSLGLPSLKFSNCRSQQSGQVTMQTVCYTHRNAKN